MKVVSVKVDEGTKSRMEPVPDVNWSEVLRAAIRVRLEAEEDLRKDLDPRRALRAAKGMDAIRARMSGRWSGSKEIRRWRDLRR